MLKIEMINKRNRELFIDRIRSDVIKHIFAFYDIQFDPDHTTIHAAFENDDLIGYLLLYTATDVPSVILECEPRVAEKLIQKAPENHFIVHTSPDLLNAVNAKVSGREELSGKLDACGEGHSKPAGFKTRKASVH